MAPLGGEFVTDPECVAAAGGGGAARGARHRVERSYPRDLEDPGYVASFLVRWGAGIYWSVRYWERSLAVSWEPKM